MNTIFKDPSEEDMVHIYDKIGYAITPDLSFSEDSAVARVVIDAYVKEGREPEGHSAQDVRNAAAVMANGAFGDIKSPSLLATMTMNLADEMGRSREKAFDTGKYIGGGDFSDLNAKEIRDLKAKVLDLTGPHVDFAYQLKRMALKEGPEFDPVQTAASLEGSARQFTRKLEMQQRAQNQGVGM